ncbi:molecular chaperone [Gammaproteobacteria bacterium 45_16_T64]|nr:molecular chaperone [Gammaproteobacteria bacterium 45_16_T64]
MFAGFDYGTSNCAMGVIDKATNEVHLVPIDRGQPYMPSALYALERELICESVGQGIVSATEQEAYIELRAGALANARRVRREHDILSSEQALFVGSEAFDQYLSLPGEGYFVKSPKSFLGASGLRPEFVNFFEDIVTAMMQSIKARTEKQLGYEIKHSVIGRPVNFQGMNAEDSNRQAIDILTVAAKRAGFHSVEFLFEPLAAGFDFETRLTEDKTVLVVDIGGGTSDCAMVRMGPNHRQAVERKDDFLGHSGERIGGNDLDIQLAGKNLMPLFGMLSTLKSGLPMPIQSYWDAVSTNNVGAQTAFNDKKTGYSLDQLMLDTTEPELLKRFIQLRLEKQNYHLVRSAEQCKIALSDQQVAEVDLDYIEAGLGCEISIGEFANAVERPLSRVISLMEETIRQAGCQPDVIYITGGSAKSPVIRQAIEQRIGNIEILDGNHFGSVTAGLTVWAQRLFR